MTKTDITMERLRELVKYEPETGNFIRLKSATYNALAGSVAGWIMPLGYRSINIDGRAYYAHRLAWFYMNGEFPSHQIDHIDLNKSNNTWSNLRAATVTQNLANSKCRPHSKSGVKGVYFDKRRGKWTAQISIRRKTHHLGSFDNSHDASVAYARAANAAFGEFANVDGIDVRVVTP